MKNINILGIHYGHNATVALMQNGEIKYCISEERFNRIKNSTGWPELSLKYIMEKVDGDIDSYVFSQRLPLGYNFLKKYKFTSTPFNKAYSEIKQKLPLKYRLSPELYFRSEIKKLNNTIKEAENNQKDFTEMDDFFSSKLNVNKEKLSYIDHHLTHALSTLFFFDNIDNEKLIFTLDGEGDGLCATVSILKDKKIKIISRVNRIYSLGYLYREVTAFLGMKPDEHEFKVMGLAPYAKREHAEKILPIFKNLLWLNDKDEFESKLPIPSIKYYLKDKLLYRRFDNIAAAIQLFTEEITVDWITRWIKKTGIKNIALAGGVFMNVKMNQKISELKEVDKITIVPSAGDESTVIGACYNGYVKYCEKNNISAEIKKINNLYLGIEYSENEIEKFLKENNYFQKYNITKPNNINKKIAEILSGNAVVARSSGRMEFGARALGNRSILANPSSQENLKIINEMIKNRDFWMPFATSILYEEVDKYILNPKNIEAPYMAITFNTTDLAYKHLRAALHTYDKTSRPQIVKKEDNSDYYEIISEFKKLTGIGGILNTSFNLHGEPNVMSPADAIYTFENSGLKYLALEQFLISKK